MPLTASIKILQSIVMINNRQFTLNTGHNYIGTSHKFHLNIEKEKNQFWSTFGLGMMPNDEALLLIHRIL